MNMDTTNTDNTALNHTSIFVNVRIEVEPNRTVHTSPLKLVEVENTFMSKYPMARAPTENMANVASPLILVFCPVRKSSMAQTTVIVKINGILFVTFKDVAMAIAPKATWESPSPMKEKRFSTKITPNKDEQRAINIPTMTA